MHPATAVHEERILVLTYGQGDGRCPHPGGTGGRQRRGGRIPLIEGAGHAHAVRPRCVQDEAHVHALRRSRDRDRGHRRLRASENQHEDGRRNERRAQDPRTEPYADLPRFGEPLPPPSRGSARPAPHFGHHAGVERCRQRDRSAIHDAEQPLGRPRLGVELRRQVGEIQLAVEKPLDQGMEHRRHSTSLSRSRSRS